MKKGEREDVEDVVHVLQSPSCGDEGDWEDVDSKREGVLSWDLIEWIRGQFVVDSDWRRRRSKVRSLTTDVGVVVQ